MSGAYYSVSSRAPISYHRPPCEIFFATWSVRTAQMLTVDLLHCSEINDKPPPGMQMPPQPSQPMAQPKKVRAACKVTMLLLLQACLRPCATGAPCHDVFAGMHCFGLVPAALGDWWSGSGRRWGCRARVGTDSWPGWTRMGRCGQRGSRRRGGTKKGARCVALAFRCKLCDSNRSSVAF